MLPAPKIRQLQQQITDAVAALSRNTQWRAMLDLSTRMASRYSLGNTLLIAAQRPDATCVAGYSAWRTAGRQVRKGERGITILAPLVRHRSDGDETPPSPAAEPVDAPGRAVVVGFRGVAVFDIAQTDGPPIPTTTPVTGHTPTGLRDALIDTIGSHGYQVRYGDCRPAFGTTRRTDHTVTILPDQPAAQDALTLAHELAHITCGHPDTGGYTHLGLAEVEAESVAYILCTAAGMPQISAASFDYIATWARGDTTLVRATAETVIRTARPLLTQLRLDPVPVALTAAA